MAEDFVWVDLCVGGRTGLRGFDGLGGSGEEEEG